MNVKFGVRVVFLEGLFDCIIIIDLVLSNNRDQKLLIIDVTGTESVDSLD